MGMRIDQSRHHETSFCVELFTSAPIAPFSCAFYPAGIINLNIAGLHIVELFVQKQAGVGYGYGHRISYIVWIFPSFRRSLIVSSAVVAASAALLPFFPIPMPQLSLMSMPDVTFFITSSACSFVMPFEITMTLSPPRKNASELYFRNSSASLL